MSVVQDVVEGRVYICVAARGHMTVVYAPIEGQADDAHGQWYY